MATSSLAAVGEWQVEAPAGEGASGRVFRARRGVALGAVKVLHAGFEPEEAALLARLDRTWGPKLLDVGRLASGESYVVTEWVEGHPLSELTKRDAQQAWIIAHAVGRALEELHGAGVRHGDVKPENVLWHDGKATLIDLGLARAFGEDARGATPHYAAPELRSGGDVGPRADVYALGVLLGEWMASPPAELAQLALLARATSPGARPSAAWIAERAAAALGLEADEAAQQASRVAMIKRVYVTLRAREIQDSQGVAPAVQGAPRVWLEEAITFARKLGAKGQASLGASTGFMRSRWLVSLVGPAAASWPALRDDEGELAARLGRIAERAPFAAWTFADLRADRSAAPVTAALDDAALVVQLMRPFPSPSLLTAGEVRVQKAAPWSVRSALVDALLRGGEAARAYAALGNEAEPDVLARRADVARRMGDVTLAEKHAREALRRDPTCDAAAAVIARLAWDGNDDDAAMYAMAGRSGSSCAEVAALVSYRRSRIDEGLGRVDEALVECTDIGAEARLRAVRGMLEHAAGHSDGALRAFGRAVELASQAGAVPEEATYLVGEAAAAAEAGDVERALRSSTRAALLFDRLGRVREAGRAWLARAAALATVGAVHDADEAAAEAIARSGDVRGRAYARWARVETRPEGDAIAREEARAALAELPEGDDGLRAAARALIWCPDALSHDAIATLDDRSSVASPVAAWEWLGARARRANDVAGSLPPREVLSRIVAAGQLRQPLASRGPTLAYARDLAESLGDVEASRRLETLRKQAAERLVATTPDELRDSLTHVPWMRDPAISADDTSLAPAQIAQFENIVRSLRSTGGLKPLLLQVLDAMVLWVGVERGLLLLRAPGPHIVLVPRAARNLAREDLRGEQLHLSMTLARRAMETGEAVVATDAFASLGDLHASVHALRLRSVLAVPLVARGEIFGVVYLDDRGRRGAFGPRELSWVRLLATQAAIAIADARDQVLLRRAVRRAERANKKLESALRERETELFQARTELEVAREDDTRFQYEAIAGRSEPMRALLRVVDRVTTSDVPVLIVGESGTGKELIARAMHQNGPRAKRAFVSENCAAVPEPLLESTLFGHVRGAFTGASQSRPGLFEVADGGTLFLDEIGEMSLAMQTKFLRVLQEGEIRPVGAERTRHVDVRLIAATHRDLEAMVQKRTFREDLYYRLNVVTVRVPSLRERRADIPLIVSHLLAKHVAGRNVRITKAAMDRLTVFPWPGNVRQLENEIRRAIVLSTTTEEGGVIDVADLSPDILRQPEDERVLGMDLRARVDALEAELLRDALLKTHGNQTRAAELLGLSRFGLQKMMKRLKVAGKPS